MRMSLISLIFFIQSFPSPPERDNPKLLASPKAPYVRVGIARWSGSGTVVGDGSYILTATHIFKYDGKNETPFYPGKPWVQSGGDLYEAKLIVVNEEHDLTLMKIQGKLKAAPVALIDVKPKTKMHRYGVGSWYNTSTAESFGYWLLINGKSDSGDSGAGYFNEKNEVVGLHLGRTEDWLLARATKIEDIRKLIDPYLDTIDFKH